MYFTKGKRVQFFKIIFYFSMEEPAEVEPVQDAVHELSVGALQR